MKIFHAILLSALSVTHVIAEEKNTEVDLKEYDIEIIIFEDSQSRYINSQSWEQPALTEEIIASTEPDNKTNKKVNATFNSIKPQILNQQYKRVSGSPEYNVLFYGAWRQPGLDKTHAFEIDIEELTNNHSKGAKNTLNGNLKLILSRYLHIYTDLSYQKNTPAIAAEEQQVTANETSDEYPIKSHRRMRSKELHYIDHPLIGILIQINPVEKASKATSL